jgi:hypothetical protein
MLRSLVSISGAVLSKILESFIVVVIRKPSIISIARRDTERFAKVNIKESFKSFEKIDKVEKGIALAVEYLAMQYIDLHMEHVSEISDEVTGLRASI